MMKRLSSWAVVGAITAAMLFGLAVTSPGEAAQTQGALKFDFASADNTAASVGRVTSLLSVPSGADEILADVVALDAVGWASARLYVNYPPGSILTSPGGTRDASYDFDRLKSGTQNFLGSASGNSLDIGLTERAPDADGLHAISLVDQDRQAKSGSGTLATVSLNISSLPAGCYSLSFALSPAFPGVAAPDGSRVAGLSIDNPSADAFGSATFEIGGGCAGKTQAPVASPAILSREAAPLIPTPESLAGPAMDRRPVAPIASEAVIDPELGGTLTGDGGEVTVEFPSDSVSEPVRAAFATRLDVTAAAGHLLKAFELQALRATGGDAPVESFLKPLRLSVAHSPAEMVGRDPRTLKIYHLDSTGRWAEVPSQVDLRTLTVTALITHFSVYSSQAQSQISAPGTALSYHVSPQSGAVTLNTPLELPSGPGGFVPSLSLSYTSARVDDMRSETDMGSWAGVGWDLSLPTIQRVPASNRYFLSMSGIAGELIREATAQANGRWRWHTKREQYLHVESDGFNVGSAGEYHLLYVRDKKGTLYEFGTTPETRQYYTDEATSPGVRFYYRFDVSRITDTHGNYMQFKHTQDLQQDCTPTCVNVWYVKAAYPTHIFWGGNSNTLKSPSFQVQFASSASRADAPLYNVSGCTATPPKVIETRYLTNVWIGRGTWLGGGWMTTDQWIRRYEFQFETTSGTCGKSGALKLTGFAQYGPDPSFPYAPGLLNQQFYRQTFTYENRDVQLKSDATTIIRDLRWPFLIAANNGFGSTLNVSYRYSWPLPPGASYGVNQSWSRQVVSQETRNPGSGGQPVTYTYTLDRGPLQNCNVPQDSRGPTYCYNNPQDPDDDDYRGFIERATVAAGSSTLCSYSVGDFGDEWIAGLELRCGTYNPAGGPIIRDVQKSYVVQPPLATPSDFRFVGLGTVIETFAGSGDRSRQTTYGYDPYGNVATAKEYRADGTLYRQTDYEYNVNADKWIVSLPRSETNRDGTGAAAKVTRYIYDGAAGDSVPPQQGDLTGVEMLDDDGLFKRIKTHEYDAYGNRTVERDGNNNPTTYIFDAVHQSYVAQETNAAGQTITYQSYDFVAGRPRVITDANGVAYNLRYDSFGRPVKEWTVLDSEACPTVTYAYNWDATPPNGTIVRRREQSEDRSVSPPACPADKTIWEANWYDSFGRLVQSRKEFASNVATVMDVAYDARGNKASESLPYEEQIGGENYTAPLAGINKTLYAYDPQDRVTRVTNPDSTASDTAYDGFNVTEIDELRHKTEHIKDPFGRTVQVNEYKGTGPASDPYSLYASTTYAYDVLDQLTGVTDHLGNVTAIQYDKLGYKKEMNDPDMGRWTYKYDPAGNLIEQTDARGQTIKITPDSLNRVSTKEFLVGGLPSGGPKIEYFYDSYPAPPGFTSYPVGRLTRVKDWSGEHVFGYDALGRRTTEQHTIDAATYTVTRQFDPLGRETSLTYPDGETVNLVYDQQGALDGMSSPLDLYLNAANTSHNAAGQPRKLGLGNYMTVDFDYVPSNLRLQTIVATDGVGQILLSLQYDYDNAGNGRSICDLPLYAGACETTTFTYDELDRLTAATGAYAASYDYNPIGNMTAKTEGSTSYILTYPPGGSPRPHAASAAGPSTFTYDANGNMSTKQSAGASTVFDYDEESRLKRITDNGMVTAEYVYDYEGNLVKKTSSGQTTVYIGDIYEKNPATGEVTKYYWAEGRRIAMRKSGMLLFLLQDHLGSTAVTTDASGNLVASTRYWPYGVTRSNMGFLFTDKLFTGQQQENANGLYFYKARFYDADIGRFIQADTIVPDADPRAINRHAYVYNNPLNYTDPTGHLVAGILNPDPSTWGFAFQCLWCSNPSPPSTLHFQSDWILIAGEEVCQRIICQLTPDSETYCFPKGDSFDCETVSPVAAWVQLTGWIIEQNGRIVIDIGVRVCRADRAPGCGSPTHGWVGDVMTLYSIGGTIVQGDRRRLEKDHVLSGPNECGLCEIAYLGRRFEPRPGFPPSHIAVSLRAQGNIRWAFGTVRYDLTTRQTDFFR